MSAERPMGSEPEMERIVRSWLQEEAYENANRVLDAVLREIDTIPQRRRLRLPNLIGLRRWMRMPTAAQVGILAAVLVVIAILSLTLRPWANVGSPGSESTAPTPSATPAVQSLIRLTSALLPPGTYRIDHVFPGSAEITIGDGWHGMENGTGLGLILMTQGHVPFTQAPNTVLLGIYVVAGAYHDPCRDSAPISPPPTTVDGLATALTKEVGFSATAIRDTTFGGLPAKTFDMDNALSGDTCPVDLISQLTYHGPGATPYRVNNLMAPGHERVWVLDYRGTLLAVIAYSNPGGQPAADVAELYRAANSIQFR